MINVDGVILAAGRSSRMGSINKVQASLGGRSLLEIAVGKISPQVDTLLINGDPALCGEQALADRLEGFQGPLMGLYTALLSEQLSAADYLMMVPCDGPFLPDNLVAELHRQIVVATRDVCEGDPVLAWPRQLVAQILQTTAHRQPHRYQPGLSPHQ